MDKREILELRREWLEHRDLAGLFLTCGWLSLAKRHYKLAFKLWRFYNERIK